MTLALEWWPKNLTLLLLLLLLLLLSPLLPPSVLLCFILSFWGSLAIIQALFIFASSAKIKSCLCPKSKVQIFAAQPNLFLNLQSGTCNAQRATCYVQRATAATSDVILANQLTKHMNINSVWTSGLRPGSKELRKNKQPNTVSGRFRVTVSGLCLQLFFFFVFFCFCFFCSDFIIKNW